MIEKKRCTKCREEKELEAFSRDKRRAYGRRSQCKECAKLRSSSSVIHQAKGIEHTIS